MKISNSIFFTTCCEEALSHYAQCGLGRVTENRFGVQWMLDCAA